MGLFDVSESEDEVVCVGATVPLDADVDCEEREATVGGTVPEVDGGNAPEADDGDSPDGPPAKRRRKTSSRPTAEMVVRKNVCGAHGMIDAVYVHSRRAKRCEPIALWPQYTLSAEGTDYWLHFTGHETWFFNVWHELVPQKSAANTREKKLSIFQHVRSEIREGIRAARRSIQTHVEMDSGDENSDDEDTRVPVAARKLTLKKVLSLPIVVGGVTMTAFNTERPLFIKLDAASGHYIANRITTLIEKSLEAAAAPAPPVGEESAQFQLSPLAFANVRGKVIWCCAVHGWKIEVKRPRKPWKQYVDASGMTLMVDPSLDAPAYRAAKAEAYARAVRAWNAIDGTKRHRIQLPSCPPSSATEESQATDC